MSDNRSRNRRRRGQWSLVGTLVALAVVAIISAWYYAKILKPQAGSHNGSPAAEQQAYGVVCGEYQSQLAQAATMYRQDNNDRPPTNFEQLKKYGATNDLLHAPGCQFQLDPSTGAITDIGHGLAAKNAPPIVLGGAPSPDSSPPGSSPAVPNNSQRGPGGITLPPTGGGNLPANSGGDDSQ
jgi:hypothetical protein